MRALVVATGILSVAVACHSTLREHHARGARPSGDGGVPPELVASSGQGGELEGAATAHPPHAGAPTGDGGVSGQHGGEVTGGGGTGGEGGAVEPCARCYPDLDCVENGVCLRKSPSCAGTDTPGCGVATIAGGSFRLGWQLNDPDVFPGVPVTLDSFAIDAYEVSVARFRTFWEAGHPQGTAVTYPDGQLLSAGPVTEPGSDTEAHNWSAEPRDRESMPINRLSWDTALAFCIWDGGRLPTEAEWEYVAVGRAVPGLLSGRTFAWGEDEPTCDLALSIECGAPKVTDPVDARPPIAGVYQIAGNVSEWTADHYEPFGEACWGTAPVHNPLCNADGARPWVARGGSFVGHYGQLLGIWRLGTSEALSGGRGFRCARDLIAR